MSKAFNSNTTEDWFLTLLPLLGPLTPTISSLLPGNSGFLAAVIIGALAKYFASLGKDRSLKNNWESWLGALVTILGLVATGLTGNVSFAQYGLILGFIAKALPEFKNGLNVEDTLLFLGALVASYATYTDNVSLTNIGLLISTVGKGLPSIANGAPAPTPTVSASTPSG
jgi:hypothetical protein